MDIQQLNMLDLYIYLFEFCGKVLKHTTLFDYLETLLNQNISKWYRLYILKKANYL